MVKNMASTKDLLRQKQRESRIRKKIILGVIIGLAVIGLIAAAVLIVQNINKEPVAEEVTWDPNAGKEIVATIDGNDVTEAEFVYYFISQISMFEQIAGADVWSMDFDGETPENFAKQKTLEGIRVVKECARRAKEEGLSPTDEKITEAEEYAAYLITSMSDYLQKGKGLNEDVLKEILIENEYSTTLFESYTADYVPDAPDYESELIRMKEEELAYWQDQAVANGDEEAFTDEEIQQIYDRVESSYITQLKNQYFETIYSPWVENISIDINNEVFDRITIADITQQ